MTTITTGWMDVYQGEDLAIDTLASKIVIYVVVYLVVHFAKVHSCCSGFLPVSRGSQGMSQSGLFKSNCVFKVTYTLSLYKYQGEKQN